MNKSLSVCPPLNNPGSFLQYSLLMRRSPIRFFLFHPPVGCSGGGTNVKKTKRTGEKTALMFP